MPTKTINFSDKAWRIIDSWDASASVSARVSAALLRWHSEMLDSEKYLREVGLEE
jgi:hypothetical protein